MHFAMHALKVCPFMIMLVPCSNLVSFVPAWLALLTESKLRSTEPREVSDGPVVEASSLIVALGVESLLWVILDPLAALVSLAWLLLRVMDLVLLRNLERSSHDILAHTSFGTNQVSEDLAELECF